MLPNALSVRHIAVMLSLSGLLAGDACGQVDVLTANYGNERTNSNPGEAVLNTSTVQPGSFGKLGAFPVDGQIYAQPLVVSGISIQGEPRNLVYVATMHNSVYAIDAEAPGSATPVWRVNFGPAVPSKFLDFTDVLPETGILSTPVIDLSRNIIYVVSDTFQKNTAVFRLHALDLATGQERLGGPVDIKATVSGTGDGSVGGIIQFDPVQHLQRPALLLANDRVYIAFGSHADQSPYHGWILAYDAGDITHQVAVFNSTPHGSGGSVWQSGRGLAADRDGTIYAGTANGDYDGVSNFSASLVRLTPDLGLLDWFTPSDWEKLSGDDDDFGSLGPVLIPGSDLVLAGDKAGNLYLLSRDKLGRLGGTSARTAQTVRAARYGGIFNVAYYESQSGGTIYVAAQGDSTRAFRLAGSELETTPFSVTPVNPDIPKQGLTVSSSNGAAGTGVLWMTKGDHEVKDVPGMLHAFDADDLTSELWNSEMNPDRDRLGGFAKFVSPTVANGRVYVPTFSGELAIYGLLPSDQQQADSSRPRRPAR